MRLSIVTPERQLVSTEATAVEIPGAEGNLTAMDAHSPTIVSLRPGILKAETSNGSQSFAVTGGFAEITGDSTSILAEVAMPVSEMTQEVIDRLVGEARTAHEASGTDAAAKLLADMVAMGSEIGLSARS